MSGKAAGSMDWPGIEPGKGGAMTRSRLAELVARYPDAPAK